MKVVSYTCQETSSKPILIKLKNLDYDANSTYNTDREGFPTLFVGYTGVSSQLNNDQFSLILLPQIISNITVMVKREFYNRNSGISIIGSGAIATATVTGGVITSVTVTNGGLNYGTPPTVIVTGGGGNGAILSAVLNTNANVTAINVINGGSGYTSAPTLSFVGGGSLGNFILGLLFEENDLQIDNAVSPYK